MRAVHPHRHSCNVRGARLNRSGSSMRLGCQKQRRVCPLPSHPNIPYTTKEQRLRAHKAATHASAFATLPRPPHRHHKKWLGIIIPKWLRIVISTGGGALCRRSGETRFSTHTASQPRNRCCVPRNSLRGQHQQPQQSQRPLLPPDPLPRHRSPWPTSPRLRPRRHRRLRSHRSSRRLTPRPRRRRNPYPHRPRLRRTLQPPAPDPLRRV